jgi:hypothetical protein
MLQRIVQKFLNLKHLSNNAGLPLSITRATFRNIFGVVSGNNFLARLRVVHNGVGVWEEFIEGPVEKASGDEGVDIADGEPGKDKMLAWLQPRYCRRCLAANSLRFSERGGKGRDSQMLTAKRDTGLAHTRYHDVVDEAG